MRYFVPGLLLLISLIAFTPACDEALVSSLGEPVEFRAHEDADPVLLRMGESHSSDVQDHQALLVIHKGLLSMQGERAVEIDKVLDTQVYAGPDDEAGDPHWITRARVLDRDGEPLWTQRVNSLYQLLEFLSVIIEDQSPIDISVEEVHHLARQEYPELLRFAIKVPNRLEGAHTYVLEIADEEGDFSELASYPMSVLEALAEEPSPDIEYEIDTLVDAGPAEDQLNVAILGDGYTEAERHIFEGDAQAVADRLMGTSPMTEHADLFNIKAIWTPSEESGAGYDCNHFGAPSDCDHGFRDNVFNTTFVIPALGDRFGLDVSAISDRVAMPLELAKIYELASLAHYDEIIFLANSPKRSGFAGLYVAVVTNFDDRDTFPDVAVHEVGHTLGLLGDEYNIPSDACYYNEPTIPLPANISEIVDGEVRWSEWVEDMTPLPTPETEEYGDLVGGFEGAYNCDFLARPEKDCMMKASGYDFCTVCSEQMVRRFYSMVHPAPHQPSTTTLLGTGEVQLTVPMRGDGERYEVVWTVDGTPSNVDRPSLNVSTADIPDDEWLHVDAVIRNASSFLHTPDQAVTSEFQFQLKKDAAP